MSQDVVGTIIQRAVNDDTFRQGLINKRKRKETLEKFDLGPEDAAVINQFIVALEKEKARPRWGPTSFREIVSACLTIVLILIFLGILFVTYTLLNTPPQAAQMGNTNTMAMYDPFARAKDLLTLLFPLFTAVISFYFGVMVEGKRADQSLMRADNAEKDMHEMEGKVMTIAGMIAEAQGNAMLVNDAIEKHQIPNSKQATELKNKLEWVMKILSI
jgi:hypothetical protein